MKVWLDIKIYHQFLNTFKVGLQYLFNVVVLLKTVFNIIFIFDSKKLVVYKPSAILKQIILI